MQCKTVETFWNLLTGQSKIRKQHFRKRHWGRRYLCYNEQRSSAYRVGLNNTISMHFTRRLRFYYIGLCNAKTHSDNFESRLYAEVHAMNKLKHVVYWCQYMMRFVSEESGTSLTRVDNWVLHAELCPLDQANSNWQFPHWNAGRCRLPLKNFYYAFDFHSALWLACSVRFVFWRKEYGKDFLTRVVEVLLGENKTLTILLRSDPRRPRVAVAMATLPEPQRRPSIWNLNLYDLLPSIQCLVQGRTTVISPRADPGWFK